MREGRGRGRERTSGVSEGSRCSVSKRLRKKKLELHTTTIQHEYLPFFGGCCITFLRLATLVTGSSSSLSPLLHELELRVGRGRVEEEEGDFGRVDCEGVTCKCAQKRLSLTCYHCHHMLHLH